MHDMTDPDRAAVTRFVRETLGCGCPPKVFDSIAVNQLGPDAGGLPAVQLLIGARLLIRLVEPPRQVATAHWVESLARAGRAARDVHGCNRFRLVVVMAHGEVLPAGLQERFTAAVTGDERTHLHVVAADQLPGTLADRLAAVSSVPRARPSEAK